MDNNHRANETLLDLSSIFWGFIDQWKAILLFSLIISLLITGIKYRYDSATYEAAVAAAEEAAVTVEQAEQRIAETLGALSSDDKAVVDFALGFNELIKDKYKYQSESPIMSIDPNHTEVLSITFRVNGDIDSSKRASLSDGYITTFNDESVLKVISESTAAKTAPDYIKELLSFSDPYEKLSHAPDVIISDDNTFNVFAIIPDGESADSFEKAITDVMKDRSNVLSKTIAPHTIETVSTGSSVSACNSVLAKQSDIYYSSSYLKSSLNAAIAEFTPEQAAAYSTVTQLQSVVNGADIAPETVIPEPAEPGISLKSTVLGFIAGILLYFFAFIVCMLFTEKIPSAGTAKKITRKRLLGECYQKAASSGLLSKLMHSQAVFDLRYRGKTNLEDQINEITHTLDAVSSREHIDSISVINTAENQNAFTNLIKAKAGSPLSVINWDDVNDEAVTDVSDAVISVSNDTPMKQLYSLVDLLDYYRINILGFIYMADR